MYIISKIYNCICFCGEPRLIHWPINTILWYQSLVHSLTFIGNIPHKRLYILYYYFSNRDFTT